MADVNSGLPVRSQLPGQSNYDDLIVKVGDATNPSTQQLTVNVDGSVNITDNGGSLTVDATDLDIRDLDATQDNIAISDGTDTLAVNADGSINSVVTATDLDIRDLSQATDSVSVFQATHDNLNANANIQVGNADVANGNPVPVSDAGGSLTVDATDLDIRDLTHVSDSVRIGDGTDFLAVNADGSINVVPQEDPGTEVVNYDTSTAIAAGASDNHDFVFSSAGKLYQVYASASGRLKAEVQIETGASTNVFNTVIVGFNSTATPDIDMNLAKYASVPSGARVRVIRTNRDNQAMDVYSTIVGIVG